MTELCPDLRDLGRCPGCGYPLRGLPEMGNCPECGQPRAPGELVLFGWGCSTREDLSNSSLSSMNQRLWLDCLGLLFTLLCSFALWKIGARAVAVIFPLLSLSAILYPRFRHRNAPAPLQVRLSADGFAQRRGLGPIDARVPWSYASAAEVRPAGGGRYRLIVKPRPKPQVWMPDDELIALEFECDPPAALKLAAAMDEWIHSSAPGSDPLRTTP